MMEAQSSSPSSVLRLVHFQSQLQPMRSISPKCISVLFSCYRLWHFCMQRTCFSPSTHRRPIKIVGLDGKIGSRMCIYHAPRTEFDAQCRGKISNEHRDKISWKILGQFKKPCSWHNWKFQLPLLPDKYASSKDIWDIILQKISFDKLGELQVKSKEICLQVGSTVIWREGKQVRTLERLRSREIMRLELEE